MYVLCVDGIIGLLAFMRVDFVSIIELIKQCLAVLCVYHVMYSPTPTPFTANKMKIIQKIINRTLILKPTNFWLVLVTV